MFSRWLWVFVKWFVCVDLASLIWLNQVLLILWVWQVQSFLLLDFVRTTFGHALAWDKDVGGAALHLFCRAFIVVAEGWPSILSHAGGADCVVVFCVQSATNAAFVHLVSWVLNLVLLLVDHVLLELSAILLVLHWNRLHWLLLTMHIVAIWIWIYLHILMLVLSRRQLMSSDCWSSTLVLGMTRRFSIGTHWNSVAAAVSILFLHLGVQCFSFIENLHQFFKYFITVELSQDLFLMLKLILRLFSLLSSLLLLDKSVRILGFGLFVLVASRCNQILAVTLRSSFGRSASLGLLSVIWLLSLAGLRHLLLIERLSVATHAQVLLVCVSKVVIVYNMHR